MDSIEETIAAGASASVARKWWMGEIVGRAKTADVDPSELGVTPETIVELNKLVEGGKINNKMASQVLDGVLAGEGTPAEIVEKRGLAVVSDDGPCWKRSTPHWRPSPTLRRRSAAARFRPSVRSSAES
ncbi:aspartyl/glutamyl-tRNA(Asn/Gln) amidotransferase subunit B [Arthrobacter sp. Hiyo8]|nr:aspartyl/glutamyl-tRNA(Asn/Gln) amidotransferase subunit B [Arthrobacter sp. Hiyo8]